MLWFSKRNHRTKVKDNRSGKLKSPVARILKLHGTCDRGVLNFKLMGFYFLEENQTQSQTDTDGIKRTLKNCSYNLYCCGDIKTGNGIFKLNTNVLPCCQKDFPTTKEIPSSVLNPLIRIFYFYFLFFENGTSMPDYNLTATLEINRERKMQQLFRIKDCRKAVMQLRQGKPLLYKSCYTCYTSTVRFLHQTVVKLNAFAILFVSKNTIRKVCIQKRSIKKKAKYKAKNYTSLLLQCSGFLLNFN